MTRMTPSMSPGSQIAPLRGPFAAAHRLMFPAAGLWAIVGVAALRWGDSALFSASPLATGAAWHGYEMIFGMIGAAFAGYTLSAATSWSGRQPLAGLPILALVLLWVAARAAAAGLFGLSLWVVLPASAGFLGLVALMLFREALAGRSARGAVQAGFALALMAAQIGVLTGGIAPASVPVLLVALLLSAVGGRIVAAFSFSHSPAHGGARFRRAHVAGHMATAMIALALLAELRTGPAGAVLLVAALAEALRLLFWQRAAIWRDGLLAMQQLAYAWLPLGLGLVGASQLGVALVPGWGALHALTAGAAAGLIYAIAARAAARRGTRLRAAPVSLAGFALLWGAAGLRVISGSSTVAEAWAPILWAGAWAFFLLVHTAALFRPALRPIFSGPRAGAASRHDPADGLCTGARRQYRSDSG